MLWFLCFSFIMIILILSAIALAIILLLFLYSIPYIFWIGAQNYKGQHLDKKDEGFGSTIKNATKLYKSKFTHKPAF